MAAARIPFTFTVVTTVTWAAYRSPARDQGSVRWGARRWARGGRGAWEFAGFLLVPQGREGAEAAPERASLGES
ncbi:hypothetical protein GCM10010442_10030 [Kitasatospora kifunensis]